MTAGAQERSSSAARALGPARCHRHHVWLASCPDCLAAHQPQPQKETRDA